MAPGSPLPPAHQQDQVRTTRVLGGGKAVTSSSGFRGTVPLEVCAGAVGRLRSPALRGPSARLAEEPATPSQGVPARWVHRAGEGACKGAVLGPAAGSGQEKGQSVEAARLEPDWEQATRRR